MADISNFHYLPSSPVYVIGTEINGTFPAHYFSGGVPVAPPPPVIPPVVSNFAPIVASSITPTTPISFDVTDESGTSGFLRIIVVVHFPTRRVKEIMYDSEGFGPMYSNVTNTRTDITNGYSFSVLRDTGWPESPIITPYIVDVTGGEAA